MLYFLDGGCRCVVFPNLRNVQKQNKTQKIQNILNKDKKCEDTE